MNIPPLISRTPPPLPDDDDDDDDEEFGSYVIGDIIDNGGSEIFRPINGESLPSSYDFIQTGSVGPVKDSSEKISFFKNGVDSPTTSSAKDHLPDVIPDCEPVVPTGLCDDKVLNGKDVPSDVSGPSLITSNRCELLNGVAVSSPKKLNESDSFAGTVTLTGTVPVTPVSSNEICDTLKDQISTVSEPLEVRSDVEDVPTKEISLNSEDFTSFAFEKSTDQGQYFDEELDVIITESDDIPQTESLNVIKSQVDEISDSDFCTFAFERPIDNYLNSIVDDGNSKEFAPSPSNSSEISCPNYEVPAVPDIDDIANSDFHADDKSLDPDEFTSFAFEKPVDHFTTSEVSTTFSEVADVNLLPTEHLDDAVANVDGFTSFAFDKPPSLQDGFSSVGFSSAADCEADEFSEFADFQTTSEVDFVFEESAPVPEFRLEDAVPAGNVEEYDATLVGKIDNNTVWCRLRYLEDTPALKYQWLSSSSNHKLLSALKIDSRNIFCGPWSRSAKILGSDSRSGNHHDVLGAPSGRHHELCEMHDASGDLNTKPTVPDAHFDWEGSGLVNPLFSSAKDDEILHCDIGGIISNQMSSEASIILKSLPDLSYMTKTYFVFKPLPVPL